MMRARRFIGCALVAVAVGCGGSSPSPAPGGSGGGGSVEDAGMLPHGADLAMAAVDGGGGTSCTSASSVCGHVVYSGGKQGTLGVAAYATMTPGFPDKFLTVDNATFPQAYALTGLADGDHWLQAILFVGHAPGMPQAGDPQSPVTKVTVHAGAPATVDLTLQ
jgi:hypothetical protein